MGKRIQQLIRAQRISDQTQKIRQALTEFKGIEQLLSIMKGTCGKSHITEMADRHGNFVQEKADIAEVFAHFCETLYARTRQNYPNGAYTENGDRPAQPF